MEDGFKVIADALGHKFVETFKSKDINALVAMYDKDAVMISSSGQTTKGKDACRAEFLSWFDSGFTLNNARVDRLDSSGHCAWVSYILDTSEGPIHSLICLKKDDVGNWLVICDVSVSLKSS